MDADAVPTPCSTNTSTTSEDGVIFAVTGTNGGRQQNGGGGS